MSEGVSQTQTPQMSPGAPGPSQGSAIFRAYQEQVRPRHGRLRYALYPAAALALIGLGVWVVRLQPEATPFRLETYRGLRTVRRGMSPADVAGILGQPVAKESRDGMECFQYGRPSLRMPSFTLHTLCYKDGKLQQVSEKHYSSWLVTQDGAIAPITLEPDEPAAPPKKDSKANAPGLAGPTQP